jgi:uncharacterized alpha-E superfamily protein
VISRVAEGCFWLHRYMERVECMARVLEVNRAFVLDVSLPDLSRWRPVVVVAGEEARFLERHGAAKIDDGDAVQRYLVWEEACPVSIVTSLRWARENARTMREAISLEMWETLNSLWLWLKDDATKRLFERAPGDFYRHLSEGCLLFHGVCHNTMLHDEPFDFMRLGMLLERASQTARILDVHHHALGKSPVNGESATGTAQWLAILRSCSASEPWSKRSRKPLSGATVAEFLLFEDAFPRSIRHCLARVVNFFQRIRARAPNVGARSQALVDEMFARIGGADLQDVLARGLHAELTWIIEGVAATCNAIHDDYFDPAMPELETAGAAAGASQVQVQTQG